MQTNCLGEPLNGLICSISKRLRYGKRIGRQGCRRDPNFAQSKTSQIGCNMHAFQLCKGTSQLVCNINRVGADAQSKAGEDASGFGPVKALQVACPPEP